MRFKLTLLLLLILQQSLVVFAQSGNKSLKKAAELESNLAYADAIGVYEEYLSKEKGLLVDETNRIKLKLANLYYLVKDFTNAERYFSEGLSSSPVLKGEEIKNYLKFAQVLSSNGRHQQSRDMWIKYTALDEQDKIGEKFIKLYSNLDPLTRNVSSYEIEYVGINTGSADFSPSYYGNGLVFVSGREKKSGIKRVFSWDNSSFLDLYFLEDLKVLGEKPAVASVSSGQKTTEDQKKLNGLSKLGTDYYTPQTPNDVPLIGNKGSDYINGSKNYEENAIILAKKFSKTLNSKYHEGPCTFFKDGQRIIFTRNGVGSFGVKKDQINRLHLYFAEKSNRDWKNITEFPYNSNEYSTGHPALNSTDDILYFVSDMPGGYGGTDIYYSIFKNGKWSQPVNLGGVVNTQGNEMFPFIDESNNLYFSSDGHPGLGDLDMFFVEINNENLSPQSNVKNLGAPLNSNRDDFGLLTDSDRTMGYFSSNRKRGGADDDIYKFNRVGTKYGCKDLIVAVINKVSKEAIGTVDFEYQLVDGSRSIKERAQTNANGTIKLCLPADSEYYIYIEQNGYEPVKQFFSNKDASDFEPSELMISLTPLVIEPIVEEVPKEKPKERRILTQRRDNSDLTKFKGVIATGEDQVPIGGVKVKFINKCNGQVQEKYTKRDGSYQFDRDPECDYELVALKDDFATSFELIEKSYDKNIFKKKIKVKSNYEGPRSLFDTKLYKVGDVVQLENIYYDSDSYKIKAKALESLDDLVEILKRYPDMIIEVYSHTDTRGNAADNLYLSQRRAREVEDYIAKRGVSRARIKAIGKGESSPVNECSDGVQCTEAEHQRNRRTEFKILQIEKIL
ncbi:WD40-like Beta Propeller Repeat [Spirosomataceae bacterium TFI 002]|nr:WD40-like Beta Propeller Repeat [Spirosomataceae bacterium TFI 002]